MSLAFSALVCRWYFRPGLYRRKGMFTNLHTAVQWNNSLQMCVQLKLTVNIDSRNWCQMVAFQSTPSGSLGNRNCCCINCATVFYAIVFNLSLVVLSTYLLWHEEHLKAPEFPIWCNKQVEVIMGMIDRKDFQNGQSSKVSNNIHGSEGAVKNVMT